MKLISLCFVAILLHLQTSKCQRYTAEDMLIALETIVDANKFPETKECLPAIKGELYPDIPYLFFSCDTNQDLISLRNFPSEAHCKGFQCWESQLTGTSRIDILYIINTYRTSIAEGTCGPRCKNNNRELVYELKWCNLLERKAISLLANCEDFKDSVFSDEIRYNNKSSWLDYVAVSFQVNEGRQQELRLILRTLLANNYLNDWDEKTNQFRRGLTIDVGCAYILRYGVTMITTLNETVNSGNVGHLCCVFGSPKAPSTSLSNVHLSSVACSKALPGFSVDMPVKNYLHRSLCKVVFPLKFITTPTISCQFENVCPQESSVRHQETWTEKPYGLFLKFQTETNERNEVTSTLQNVVCNLPKLPSFLLPDGDDMYNYNCTHDYKLVNEADLSACQGWFCDESQLTGESKHLIWRAMNKAREMVAQGTCSIFCKTPCDCLGIQYCNVAELRWHWYLEVKAIEKVKNCPSKNSFQKVTYLNSPLLEPVYFEEVTLVFDLPPEGQIKLADKLTELFWTNALNDWAPDGTFRRGNAMWMGCAIVVRPQQTIPNIPPELKLPNGVPTHMVCIFASLEEKFSSEGGPATLDCCPTCTKSPTFQPCRIDMVKNMQPFPHLCRSTFSLEITTSCAINNCPKLSEKSVPFLSAWARYIRGYTLEKHGNGSFDYTYRYSAEEKTREKYAIKICNVALLLFGIAITLVLLVVSLLYKHNVEKRYYSS